VFEFEIFNLNVRNMKLFAIFFALLLIVGVALAAKPHSATTKAPKVPDNGGKHGGHNKPRMRRQYLTLEN